MSGKKSVAPATRTTAPRRQALSPEKIVTVALELVEAHGLTVFSTRRLGHALACEAMSIYHHYPSKQHLLDAMVDCVVSSFKWPASKLDPIERLRRVCYSYRDLAYCYPRFFPYVAVHRLNTETGVRFIERILTAFEAVTPDHEIAARYFRAIGYYLVGAALDETSGYAIGPSAAQPVTDAYVAANCPRLVAAAPYFARTEWDKTFALGLDALIDDMIGK